MYPLPRADRVRPRCTTIAQLYRQPPGGCYRKKGSGCDSMVTKGAARVEGGRPRGHQYMVVSSCSAPTVRVFRTIPGKGGENTRRLSVSRDASVLQGNVGSVLKAVEEEEDQAVEKKQNAEGDQGGDTDGHDSSVVGFLSLLSLQQYPEVTDVFRDAVLQAARYFFELE